MAYKRTTWKSGETPLSAANMNNIEDGIEQMTDYSSGACTALHSSISSTESRWYEKVGRLVQFYFCFSIASGASIDIEAELFSGLPAPLHISRFTGMLCNSRTSARFTITYDGKLTNAYTTPSAFGGETVQVSGMYIAKE